MISKKLCMFASCFICLSLFQSSNIELLAKKCKSEVKIKGENPCAIKKKGGSLGETHEEKTIFKNITNIVNTQYSPYQTGEDCNSSFNTACVSGVLISIKEARIRTAEVCHAIINTEQPIKSATQWLKDYENNLKAFKDNAEKLKKSFDEAIKEYKEAIAKGESSSNANSSDSKAAKKAASQAKKAANQEKKGASKIEKYYSKLVELANNCPTMNEQLVRQMDLTNPNSLVTAVNAAFIVLQEKCHNIVNDNIFGPAITDQFQKLHKTAVTFPKCFKACFETNIKKLITTNNNNYKELVEYINKSISKNELTMVKEVENVFDKNNIEAQQEKAKQEYKDAVLETYQPGDKKESEDDDNEGKAHIKTSQKNVDKIETPVMTKKNSSAKLAEEDEDDDSEVELSAEERAWME